MNILPGSGLGSRYFPWVASGGLRRKLAKLASGKKLAASESSAGGGGVEKIKWRKKSPYI